MAEQTALSFYQLIGAPLYALVEAETYAAEATAQFIERVGFQRPAGGDPERPPEDFGELRKVTFYQERRGPDAEPATYKVEVPLLSILPIPALQIKDAELEFAVKVIETISSEGAGSRPQAGGGSAAEERPEEGPAAKLIPTPPRVDLKAQMGRSRPLGPGVQKSQLDMQVYIKIRVEQADVPAGLSRLFNLMEESISSTQVEKT
jgi:hypothetical protein